MFQQDYIMRQVEMLTQIVAKVLGKETVEYEWEEEAQSAADHLYLRLMRLVEEGRLNEGENLLFEELNPDNSRYLEVALAFYAKLNSLDSDTLEARGFSRREVEEGLRDAAAQFGLKLE